MYSNLPFRPNAIFKWRFITSTRLTYSSIANFPTEADVIVIGGGAVGCSTLYHLAKLGVRQCLLIEKAKIASGTTWHTAGLLWRLRPSDVDIELLAHTRLLNKEILVQELAGDSTGWTENGGMFIANNKKRLEEYRRLNTLGKFFGIDSKILSPRQTKELYPLLNTEDIFGALFSPGDGSIDQNAYCRALLKIAKQNGAQVIEDCTVQKIIVKQNDYGYKVVDSLETKSGIIKTKAVVNCTGVWAPKLASTAGLHVPLLAMKHAYIVTQKIEGITGMPNVRDHDSSIYLKTQGSTLAVGGYELNPIFCDKIDDDFAYSLFNLDWEVFNVNMKGASNRLPALRHAGVKTEICGPESFTPDHKPLLGESRQVRNFFHGCGFNSAGIMLSGGCGRELAQWIVSGRPNLHMHAYNIDRFCAKSINNLHWIRERSHEAYANNYEIVFPNDEPLAGRSLIKGPLYERLLDKGCVYQERAGRERPGWFSQDGAASPIKKYDYYGFYNTKKHDHYLYKDRLDLDHIFDYPPHHEIIGEECVNCQKNVALFDISDTGKFYLAGPDAKSLADWLFCSNISSQPNGTTSYTLMLNDDGGIEFDVVISVVEKDFLNPSTSSTTYPNYFLACDVRAIEMLKSHVTAEIQKLRLRKVDFWDVTNEICAIGIRGPKSTALLDKCDIQKLQDNHSSKFVQVAGKYCRLVHWRPTSKTEVYELYTTNENALEFYDILYACGSTYFGAKDAGYRAAQVLDLEQGRMLWGADIRPTDTPLEAGLSKFCRLDDEGPAFRGRKALGEQKKRGLRKRLVRLTIDGNIPLWGNEIVYRNGRVVGLVRRAGYGFTIGKSIAHAYIESDANNGDQTLADSWIKNADYEIEVLGSKYRANIQLINM